MSNQQLNPNHPIPKCESHYESLSLVMHGILIMLAALILINGRIAWSLYTTPSDVKHVMTKEVVPQLESIRNDVDGMEVTIKKFEESIADFHSRMVFLEDTVYIVSEEQRDQARIIYGRRDQPVQQSP